MKLMMFLLGIVLLGATRMVYGMSSGPVDNNVGVCNNLMPSASAHAPNSQAGNGGYLITTDVPFNETETLYSYTSGMTYNVAVTSGATPIAGFLVQAIEPSGNRIGTFNPGAGQRIVICTGVTPPQSLGSSIGHSANARQPTENFTWTAPASDGFVDFMYTVVQTQVTYYARLSAAAPGDTTTMMPVTTAATDPPTPPPGLTQPVRAPESYALIYKTPTTCGVSDCTFYAGIDTNAGNPDYLDFYIEGDTQSWVAVGFSDSPSMFDADVLACNIGGGGVIEVLDSWTLAAPDRGSTVDNVQDVYLFSGNYSNDRIFCSFARSINGSDVPNQDLNLSEDHFVLYGGNSRSGFPGGINGHPPGEGSPAISGTRANAANGTTALPATGALPGTVTTPDRTPEAYRITARSPESCTPSSCDIFVGIDTNAGDPNFLDVYIEGNAQAWVAVGFSLSADMFDADVLGCNMNPTTNMVEVLDTWNPSRTVRNNVRDEIFDVGLFSGSSQNGRISCSFGRSIAGSDVPNSDLRLDQPLFIIFGVSPGSPSPNSLVIHQTGGGNPMVSPSMVNPAEETVAIGTNPALITRINLTRAHGIIMIIAWPLLAVIAIFFAAWMRPALPNGEWFQVHRAFMIASLIVGLIGFVLIFVAQYRSSPIRGLISLGSNNPVGTAHFAIGIIVMLLQIANPIISLFRCHPGTPNRWIFNLSHGAVIGLGAEILALINVGIGISLFSQNFSIFQPFLTIFYVYLGWLVFFLALIGVLFLLFTVLACTTDDDGRKNLAPSLIKPLISGGGGGHGDKSGTMSQGVELAVPGQKAPQPAAADKPKVPSRDAPIRWSLLGLFLSVTIVMMVVLIILIAIN